MGIDEIIFILIIGVLVIIALVLITMIITDAFVSLKLSGNVWAAEREAGAFLLKSLRTLLRAYVAGAVSDNDFIDLGVEGIDAIDGFLELMGEVNDAADDE